MLLALLRVLSVQVEQAKVMTIVALYSIDYAKSELFPNFDRTKHELSLNRTVLGIN